MVNDNGTMTNTNVNNANNSARPAQPGKSEIRAKVCLIGTFRLRSLVPVVSRVLLNNLMLVLQTHTAVKWECFGFPVF